MGLPYNFGWFVSLILFTNLITVWLVRIFNFNYLITTMYLARNKKDMQIDDDQPSIRYLHMES